MQKRLRLVWASINAIRNHATLHDSTNCNKMSFLLNGGGQYLRDKWQLILIIVGATLINMQHLTQFKLKWRLGIILKLARVDRKNLSPHERIDRLTLKILVIDAMSGILLRCIIGVVGLKITA